MIHSTISTGTLTDDGTNMSVIQLTDSGNEVFEAKLRCTDPTGQIFCLTLGWYWFFGMPEIDFSQATINGDSIEGKTFAMRHADKLYRALTAEPRFRA